MTCRELADFIMDYLTGDLPRDVHREFESHLEICSNCQRYLETYKAATELGRRAFDDENQSVAEAGVPEELVEAILAARRSA